MPTIKEDKDEIERRHTMKTAGPSHQEMLFKRKSTKRLRESSIKMSKSSIELMSNNFDEILDESVDLGLSQIYVTLHNLSGLPSSVQNGYTVKIAYGNINKLTLLFNQKKVMKTIMDYANDDGLM